MDRVTADMMKTWTLDSSCHWRVTGTFVIQEPVTVTRIAMMGFDWVLMLEIVSKAGI